MTDQPSLFSEGQIPLQPVGEEPTVSAAVRGLTGRVLAWVVGGILGLVGAVTTIGDLLHHHHGLGPYLLAGGCFILFLAAIDMWRVQRRQNVELRRRVTALDTEMTGLRADVRHLTHDRDEHQQLLAKAHDRNQELLMRELVVPPPNTGGDARVEARQDPSPFTTPEPP
jgi:hypothetical protein